MMEWISVDERLPEIPEGRHAVKVIVCSHDPVYEELNPGKGSETSTAMWMLGELDEPWFHDMLLAGGPRRKGSRFSGFVPAFDEVTHWMYYPKPIQKGEKVGHNCETCEDRASCGL